MARRKKKGRPSPRMIRLYHDLIARLGEPADLWAFDPVDCPNPASSMAYKNVAAWPADDEVDVCTFFTMGMSDRVMPGADYRVELHMGIRAYLGKEERLNVARFLADLAEYPFDHNRTLDFWHVLKQPGKIPHFPSCPHLIFHPRMTEAGFDTIADSEGEIRVFFVVPITPHERQLAIDRGKDALLDYWCEMEVDLFVDRIDPPKVDNRFNVPYSAD